MTVNVGTTSRLPWLVARVGGNRRETDSARTIELTVPGWGGHLAGQHIDLKLTAEDGYSAQRSYSLSQPSDGEDLQITVQRITDGEVSPYLYGVRPGEEIEIRGPVGGWFVWRPDLLAPVLLVGGGSGIVPLMAMLRQRAKARVTAGFRLVYSVRSPRDVYYARELEHLERECDWLHVRLVYTRSVPREMTRPPGRIFPEDLLVPEWAPENGIRIYICGPTGFVEAVSTVLIEQGHQPSTIRTERFGPTA